jgi:predicted phage replisome organizer
MFFGNQKIGKLRRLPDGDRILLSWLMLLALGGKCNDGGRVYITPTEPYAVNDLADAFSFKEKLMQNALDAFVRFGMISIDSAGFILILNWSEYQQTNKGSDKGSEQREKTRERVARFRERKKAECNSKRNVTERYVVTERNEDVTQCNATEEIDKDIDITTTTNIYLSYLQSEEHKIHKRVAESFQNCGFQYHPDVINDFIAYNKSRDWLGIGGESVLDNLDRYVNRWCEGEKGRRGEEQ